MKYTVYKITNIITNKIYVGATKKPIKARWESHKRDSKSGSKRKHPFYLDILKYGYIHFKIDVIEECDTEQQMFDRESFWIQKLHSIYPSGYNLNAGLGVPIPANIKQYDDNTIESKIVSHIKRNGLRYGWLCKNIGISNSHLSNMLNYNKKLTPETVDKINKVLGTQFKL